MFQLNSQLIDLGYSLTELENMLPWEREVYESLIQQRIEKENEARSKQ